MSALNVAKTEKIIFQTAHIYSLAQRHKVATVPSVFKLLFNLLL